MKKYQSSIPIVFVALLMSCIPTIEIDPDPVAESIEISVIKDDLLVGEEVQLTWTYVNEFKVEELVSPTWYVSDSEIATVEDGKLLALKAGQVNIKAGVISIGDSLIESNQLFFTITNEKSDLTKVVISNGNLNPALGETIQLNFSAKDGNQKDYIGTTFTWASTNESVATVSSEGELLAVGEGTTLITLTIDGIQSAPITVTVGNNEELLKSGVFENSSYSATGTATLRFNESNQLVLDFSEDFNTIFLKGTWVFMSNSLNGGQIKVSGLRVQNISNTISGAQSFNITNIDEDVDLDTYKYVIILCEPAGITMAFAELK